MADPAEGSPPAHAHPDADNPRPDGWRPEWGDRKPRRSALPKAPPIDAVPCPDPSSPDAARQIHNAAFRRLWAVIHGPDTTPQDVISAYAATRLASRVGADKTPTKRARLRVETIMPPTGHSSAGTSQQPE